MWNTKKGADAVKMICNLKLVDMKMCTPTRNDKKLVDIDEKIWMTSWQAETKQAHQYLEGCNRVYDVGVKLCLPCLSTRLKGASRFCGVQDREDSVSLLPLI